jgi:cytochrome P450
MTLAPAIDLASAASFEAGHPWDQYAWLRRNAPVYWHPEPDGPGFWAVTTHREISAVSRQPKVYSSYAGGIRLTDPDPATLAAARKMMLTMDPPQHDRHKQLVGARFSRRNVAFLTAGIGRLCDQILDDLGDREECDFIQDIAGRLPSGVIAELIGIPRADGERLYRLTEIIHTTDSAHATAADRTAAREEMLEYLAGVARDKRRRPDDAIASALLAATIDGDRLTDDEFGMFLLLLINAGGDTTRNLLADGMRLLCEHPADRQRLAADLDGLLPTAIEELLRSVSPVIQFRRTAVQDAVLRDTPIRAGDKVVVYYAAGNRDEDVFDEPDRFDITRSPNPHLAFGGGGPHLCLGLHIARVEIDAMLRRLLIRLPDLAPAGPAPRLPSNLIAGPQSMPVRLR